MRGSEVTCRTCGDRSSVEEEQDGPESRRWILLGCLHWQLEPGPGELVATLDEGTEVWARFDVGEPRSSATRSGTAYGGHAPGASG